MECKWKKPVKQCFKEDINIQSTRDNHLTYNRPLHIVQWLCKQLPHCFTHNTMTEKLSKRLCLKSVNFFLEFIFRESEDFLGGQIIKILDVPKFGCFSEEEKKTFCLITYLSKTTLSAESVFFKKKNRS
jgi:hypothetical protein